MSSAAELALKKKYALLAKKKQAAAGGAQTGGSGGGAGGSGAGAAAAAAQDPARLAAIRALQAKRAEAEAKAAAPPAAVAAPAAEPGAKPAAKVKLVIPKRDVSASPQAARTLPSKPGSAAGSAPGDPARAAALAALRAKAAQGQAGAGSSSHGQASGAAEAQQQQQQPKRPALKRPSARPRPTPQQQLQQGAGSAAASTAAAVDGTDAYPQQQFHEPGSYNGGAEYEDDRQAKRQRLEQQQGPDHAGDGGEANTTLFVGDLPQFWSTADLLDFFAAEFGQVLEARVIGSQCYGFVTFASAADAEGVLEFAQQQGIWADERMLRINWAQGSIPDWKKGPAVHRTAEPGEGPASLEAYEHPRVKEARLQAQQVAANVDNSELRQLVMERPPARELVSYEDL